MTTGLEQLDAMRMGVTFRFPIVINQFSISLRPITVAENVKITSEVVADLQKVPEAGRTSLLEANLLAKKTLVMASTSEPGLHDPQITDYVLDRFTPDELQHFYMLWVDGVKRCSPTVESFTDAELLSLADHVKKNPETVTSLSRSRLSALALYLLTIGG